MKPITLHPLSLIAGAALAFLVSAQTATPIGPRPAATTQLAPVTSSRIPAADMVRIDGGSTYAVPAGRTLVLTYWPDTNGGVGVGVNGPLAVQLPRGTWLGDPAVSSLTFPGGSAIELFTRNQANGTWSPMSSGGMPVSGYVLGYLD